MTVEEKRILNAQRRNAVRNAWKNEQMLVEQGKGTRNWTVEEQKELLENGHISGYEGHHMKSVSEYQEFAGNANNIQFLTHDEHINGAHKGNTHSLTNGYYNVETQSMEQFENNELGERPTYDLSNTVSQSSSYEQSESYELQEDYSSDNTYSNDYEADNSYESGE